MERIKSNKLVKFSLIIFVYTVIFSFLVFNLPAEYIYADDTTLESGIESGENNETGDDEKPGEDKETKKSKKPHPIIQYTISETDGGTTNFDGSQSFDNDGTIVSYRWDFGDGNTGRGSIITHTFDTPGIYRVTLTVTDNEGLENSCEKNVNIKLIEDEEPEDDEEPYENEEPGTEPGPGENEKPEENKSGNSKNSEEKEGAGKKDIIPAENAASAAEDIKHVENTVAVVEVPVPRENEKPHAKIEYSFSKTNTNTVYLGGSGSLDADGNIIYYHWDFGDGNTASGAAVTHAYDKPGLYRITLTVIDNEGFINSTSRIISIKSSKIDITGNNGIEGVPHDNREEQIKNMGRNLNEFKDSKISPPKEPGDFMLKINNMFKNLLYSKQGKNVDTVGININSMGELLDIQKITENHSLKEVIDLDELIDINYERDKDRYRDDTSDKKIKLPDFFLNFWNKFKKLVTL